VTARQGGHRHPANAQDAPSRALLEVRSPRPWEEGGIGQWVRLGDSILATDGVDEGKRARVIPGGLRDGAVRELYSELVGDHDRKDFLAW
jgi:hypothetical protein